MFGETTISYVKIGNHPIETTIYKWLFGVPGIYVEVKLIELCWLIWLDQMFSQTSVFDIFDPPVSKTVHA